MNEEQNPDLFKSILDRINNTFNIIQDQQVIPEAVHQQAVLDLQILIEELHVASEELQERDESLNIAQEIIEAERQRYLFLFDDAPDGYVVTNEIGRILEANQAAAGMLGVNAVHLVSKPITIYIESQYRRDVFKEINAMINDTSGKSVRVDKGEVLLRPRNRPPIWAKLTIAAGAYDRLRYPGKVIVLWMIHDIQEIKKAQEELRIVNDALEERVKQRTQELVESNEALRATLVELERRNKELQEFAFAASHDLQEPLRKISKFGELVMAHAQEEMDSESADYVQRMVNASRRMEAMIASLLEYARVSTQQQPYTPMDLTALALEVASDLDIARGRVGGQIDIRPLPIIEADPVQMRQLLQNLITNGLKFHQEKVPPKVEVSGRLLKDGSQSPKVANHPKEAGWAELRVKDNGIGFDVKYFERMLQPFERLNRPGEYEGTGMGLAICRKIIERHGGRLAAESAAGKGTTIIVTLPIKQEAR